ncbi:endonuclease [Buchnera aphidicola (Kurisakia onigurumii)]|uniref:endonuclease n=1 Tax=Buchnera aphidicola TaxID=9 RepID=UPI0031B6E0B7
MLKKIIFIILFFSIFNIQNFKYTFSSEFRQNNFNQAKKFAIKISKKFPKSFYCGCTINWNGKKGIPDLKSCNYKIRKNRIRANRIEWDHIVPAWEFGHNKKCWKKGGRKKCSSNSIFKKMESDLHNLQPAIGEINGDRSNFSFYEWKKNHKKNFYGSCHVLIDFKNKKIEPPNSKKGIISRTYLYMSYRYKIKIPKKQMILFKKWNSKYPVNKWECQRDNLIYKIQGNHNQYVHNKCIKIPK